jgi:uncharacterized membrane protein
VTFANPLPLWGVGCVVAAAGAVAWLAYRHFAATGRRRVILTGLRFLTLLLLALFLMRPIRAVEGARDAVVPILVDASRSMGIEDTGARRIDRARELLTRELLPVLGPAFSVEVLAFGEGLSATSPSALAATARRSDLSGALATARERYRGRPVPGVILLSDGGDTSGAAATGTALEGLPPIYAFGIGSRTSWRDREVLSVTAADGVFDDSRVDLAVSAVSRGEGTAPVTLRLLENGRPREVRRVAPAADGVPVHEIFQVTPGRGAPTVYTIEMPAAPGELVAENNTRSTLVLPPARLRRVLFLEGAPGFEHSFLTRAWASDPGLELDAVVRKGRNDQGADTFYIQAPRSRSDALTGGYPRRAEDLFAYDALVLANVDARQLTAPQLEMTRAFVGQRGGGLLVLGARSFAQPGLAGSAVEEVLPLQLSNRGDSVLPAASPTGLNRVALTAAGESHPVMQIGVGAEETRRRWDAAPALASIVPLGGPRPGATVLAVTGGAGGGSRALVAVQRYGEGRSMTFTGEASWRWRMMLPSSDRSYDTFWRQALRWLALPAGDPVAVALPAGVPLGETVAVRVAVRDKAFVAQTDAVVDLRITAPDGRIEQVRAAAASGGGADDAGWYVARFRAEQPGVYRISGAARRGALAVGSASGALLVGGADVEMSDPRLNLPLLQRVAASTGGRIVAPGDGKGLVEALRAGMPAARMVLMEDLWHNGWSFAVIVTLLGGEWVLRRRWGLR